MNKQTLERIAKDIKEKTTQNDYPLCYSKSGQVLTMSNHVLYIGSVQDAKEIVMTLNRENIMTKQEMRFLRRELINKALQEWYVTNVRLHVRILELYHYGQELKVY